MSLLSILTEATLVLMTAMRRPSLFSRDFGAKSLLPDPKNPLITVIGMGLWLWTLMLENPYKNHKISTEIIN
jgi:hypothetical protein